MKKPEEMQGYCLKCEAVQLMHRPNGTKVFTQVECAACARPRFWKFLKEKK